MSHRISYVTKRIALYIVTAGVLGSGCAATWRYGAEYELLIFISWALFFATAGFIAVALLEAYHLFIVYGEEAQDHQVRMYAKDPDFILLKAQREMYETYNQHIKLVQSCNPKQLAILLMQSEIYWDSNTMSVDDRKFNKTQAFNVIYGLSEDQYGDTYLPTLWDKKEGTVIYRVIKDVTDELMAKGGAYRRNSTDRARLTVTRDEAMALLYAEE